MAKYYNPYRGKLILSTEEGIIKLERTSPVFVTGDVVEAESQAEEQQVVEIKDELEVEREFTAEQEEQEEQEQE